MAIKTSMGWMADKKRWRKIYKGRLYQVSCLQLGTPETMVGSYQAAEAWWKKKRAEVEAAPPALPMQSAIDELERRREWAQSHGESEIVRRIEANIEEAKTFTEASGLMSRVLLGQSSETRAVWADRLRTQTTAPDADRTIAHHVDRFISLEQVRAKSGQLSVSEFDTIRRCLADFRDWIGGSILITSIDADRWESWWLHLIGVDCSLEYKKRKLRIARTFLAWLAEKGLIAVPPNLHARKYRFKGTSRKIPTIPNEDVKLLISEAPGQLRLHLLLMLNCGFTQIDISDLKPTDVDWKLGRIKRKRSKTEDHEDVPEVDYPLWSDTWELLLRFGRREGDNALLTESGKVWVRDFLKADGKRSKSDMVKANYSHLMRRTKTAYPLKLFRKTAAERLETHEIYGSRVELFLGHAPSTMATRHYAPPSQEIFNKAVTWLGKSFGFETEES